MEDTIIQSQFREICIITQDPDIAAIIIIIQNPIMETGIQANLCLKEITKNLIKKIHIQTLMKV